MKTVEMLVTPEMAKELLENHNNRNRHLDEGRVFDYARLMSAGLWDLTHQSIAIANDGTIVDGQHRLAAVKHCNIPVRFMVTLNAPRSMNIDCGRLRSITDGFYMAGEDKTSLLCSREIITLVDKLHFLHTSRKLRPDRYAVSRYIKDNEVNLAPIKDIIKSTKQTYVKGAKSSTVYVAMYSALVSGEDPVKLKKWYKVLCTGVYDDSLERSILLARNMLLSSVRETNEKVRIAKFMESIYCFCHGVEIKRLYARECYIIPEFNQKLYLADKKV